MIRLHQPDDRGAALVDLLLGRLGLLIVSVKSIAVSVNSCSIESALSPTVWP